MSEPYALFLINLKRMKHLNNPQKLDKQMYGVRPNLKPVKAIDLLGIQLSDKQEPGRNVDKTEVNAMRSRMQEHSEETNEMFNLMARHIKIRGEERINLYQVDENDAELDIDGYLLDNADLPRTLDDDYARRSTSSAGHSPARDPTDAGLMSATKMQTLLESQTAASPQRGKTVKPFRLNPNVIYLKNTRDRVLLMAEKPRDVPECEHGYWGGFSPKRKGKYQDQHLTKRFPDGRARLYPARKMAPSISLPKPQDEMPAVTPKLGSPSQNKESLKLGGIRADIVVTELANESGDDSVQRYSEKMLPAHKKSASEAHLNSTRNQPSTEKANTATQRSTISHAHVKSENTGRVQSDTQISDKPQPQMDMEAVQRAQTTNIAGVLNFDRSFGKRSQPQVTFGGKSTSGMSQSKSGFRKGKRSSKRGDCEGSEEDVHEYHLPYWERKAYKSYKHLKRVQPELDTTVRDYIDIKIDEQEQRLIKDAMKLRLGLKAVDGLTHNGINSDMADASRRNKLAKASSMQQTIPANFNSSSRDLLMGETNMPTDVYQVQNRMIQSSKGHYSIKERIIADARHHTTNDIVRAQTAQANKGMRTLKNSIFGGFRKSSVPESETQKQKTAEDVDDIYLKNSKYFNSMKSEKSSRRNIIDTTKQASERNDEPLNYESLQSQKASNNALKQKVDMLREQAALNMKLALMKVPETWKIDNRNYGSKTQHKQSMSSVYIKDSLATHSDEGTGTIQKSMTGSNWMGVTNGSSMKALREVKSSYGTRTSSAKLRPQTTTPQPNLATLYSSSDLKSKNDVQAVYGIKSNTKFARHKQSQDHISGEVKLTADGQMRPSTGTKRLHQPLKAVQSAPKIQTAAASAYSPPTTTTTHVNKQVFDNPAILIQQTQYGDNKQQQQQTIPRVKTSARSTRNTKLPVKKDDQKASKVSMTSNKKKPSAAADKPPKKDKQSKKDKKEKKSKKRSSSKSSSSSSSSSSSDDSKKKKKK